MDDDLSCFTDLGKKKKRAKIPAVFEDEEGASPSPPSSLSGEGLMDYQDMVNRAYQLHKTFNKHAFVPNPPPLRVPHPQMAREGTKKTVFVNFAMICERLGRQKEHPMSYILSELGTTGVTNEAGHLIIKGRFKPQQMEVILKNYVSEYVLCKSCKAHETMLVKENRLTFVQCGHCYSKYSVSIIKAGYSASQDVFY